MPNPLQQLVADAAGDVEARVQGLWRRHTAGTIDRAEFTAFAAALIAGGNARSAALADLGVAATLSGSPGPVGIDPFALDEARLTQAVSTAVSDDTVDIAARLGLLARSEALNTAQDATTSALKAHDASWRRVTDSEPCALCSRWADGKARPWSVRMARHTGCACLQQAVR